MRNRSIILAASVICIVLLLVTIAGCTSGGEAGGEVAGKPVVIDFWIPRCAPCQQMEPIMEQLQEEYGDRVDFKAYNGMTERGKADQYGVSAYPTFIFISEEGTIEAKVIGQVSMEVMRGNIEALLSGSRE